ncbi:MAG TPA: hypothetical protein VFM05_14575 [Candidatus Saccharimonadales bacterium]|nr:hypothetical protein [Candidatus Saccharimonadales bacterium]
MKKVKILSHPTQITTIQLDDLDYETNSEGKDRMTRLQIRKWRRLRNELA